MLKQQGNQKPDGMRVLLLSSAYNSLTQAAHVELGALGIEVSVELFLDETRVREGIEIFQPDLIICPMLKQKIPDDIWQNHKCIIVHPGIRGDRGPSSLDWAILDGVEQWGVTALEASEEMDAGDIWAWETFPTRNASKSSLYRDEVVRAGVKVILETVERFQQEDFRPTPLD